MSAWASLQRFAKSASDSAASAADSARAGFNDAVTEAKQSPLVQRAIQAVDLDMLQPNSGKVAPRVPVDLDLTYVTPRVACMGYPSAMTLDRYGSFLRKHHTEHFMVWNLSEKTYNYGAFGGQVMEFKFPGHPAPPLGLLFKMCNSIESWLLADSANVAVIHCSTGKGRTTTLAACFLAWCGELPTPMEALEFVCEKRGLPVERMTIPSQRRYTHFFTNMMDGVKPRAEPLQLRRIIVNGVPDVMSAEEKEMNPAAAGCRPYVQIFKHGRLLFTSQWADAKRSEGTSVYRPQDGSFSFTPDVVLDGDILVRCRHIDASSETRISMFRAAFHTGYVPSGILRLTAAQLDGACADERYDEGFFVDMIFAEVNHAEGSASAEGGGRPEGVEIQDGDKEAFDAVIASKSRFWEEVNKRKKMRAVKRAEVSSAKNGPENCVTGAPVSFSILGDDDEIYVESGAGAAPEKESDELRQQLMALSMAGSDNKMTDTAPSATTETSEASLSKTQDKAADYLDELEELEKELGLASLSKELRGLPDGSSESAAAQPPASQSSTSPRDAKGAEVLCVKKGTVDLDDEEDSELLELESYLSGLGSPKNSS